MDNRELRAPTQRRLTALRAAAKQRGAELVTETEARLQAITDEANRKIVAVLREFEDLADGGRWPGGRQVIFEAPRFCRPSADRTRRHQALMAFPPLMLALCQRSVCGGSKLNSTQTPRNRAAGPSKRPQLLSGGNERITTWKL